MLSRQIASKLRGYETPFYLYDTALLRQTLESVVAGAYGMSMASRYNLHDLPGAVYSDEL